MCLQLEAELPVALRHLPPHFKQSLRNRLTASHVRVPFTPVDPLSTSSRTRDASGPCQPILSFKLLRHAYPPVAIELSGDTSNHTTFQEVEPTTECEETGVPHLTYQVHRQWSLSLVHSKAKTLGPKQVHYAVRDIACKPLSVFCMNLILSMQALQDYAKCHSRNWYS
jgi:hypothetical protein